MARSTTRRPRRPSTDHADRIRSQSLFEEVRTVFWKETPALHDAQAVTSGEEIYVVPVLTSEGYFADQVFPRELGESDASVQYTDPVGTHVALRAVIQDRIEATATGPRGDVGIALVGHGTERNEQSALATKAHARRLRASGTVAEVVSLPR
ncbi:MAG: CbiX/SirB N-terminal domain-containing protein [Natrialbaceae archaeon]|nr:CbiX/SirB N-terminal domain-containing protein [Natrialbaceae archaeon]